MDRLKIAIFVTFLSSIQCQRTPTISYVTPDISTIRRSTIDMDCSVLYATEYPILWMKIGGKHNDGRPIPLSSGSSLIIRDNRFALRYDTASATYTLQIKDVQRSDEARYECQIIVGINNKVAESTNLIVSEPPIINDNSTRSVVVNELEAARLECTAMGAPRPKISWRRADNAILPTGGLIYKGSVLKIHSVKKEDRGTYYCVADNNVGEAAKRAVALEVEFAPVIDLLESSGNVRKRQGCPVSLDCPVEAYPAATVTWIHNGIQRSRNDENYAISKGSKRFAAIGDGHSVSTLRIKRINRDTVGKYECRAQNKFETLAKAVFVVEEDWSEGCEATGTWGGASSHSAFVIIPILSIVISFVIR